MTQHSTDLSALLGSRICHDLISPLGAIGNGVELLSMAGISAAPEIALIEESIENANARIRFFRIAFGMSSDGASVVPSEVTSILRDLYKGSRCRVDWRISEARPRNEIKLTFLLIQCLENAMPWGGSIKISNDNGRTWLAAESDKLKMDSKLWSMLTSETVDFDVASANVHFALAPDAARRSGLKINTQIGDNSIVISF